MEELKLQNKIYIFNKLDDINNKDNFICCNDLFNIISSSIASDRRLINSYDKDEVILMWKKNNGKLRNCRFFTHKGLVRYLSEGKIFNHKNVCEYFNVDIIDKELIKIYKYKNIDGTFDTKKILKWLFGKRKACSSLNKFISLEELSEWLIEYKKNDILINRKNKILSLVGYKTEITESEIYVVDECNIVIA